MLNAFRTGVIVGVLHRNSAVDDVAFVARENDGSILADLVAQLLVPGLCALERVLVRHVVN